MVLFGSEDIYGPTVGRLFARYADAKHVVLEGAGHLPWLQSPEAFRRELGNFFERKLLKEESGNGFLSDP